MEAVHGKKCRTWRTIGGAPYDGQIGDCDVIIDYGACTDPNAINDPNAVFDDGSCEYENTCNGIDAWLIYLLTYTHQRCDLLDADGGSVASGSGFSSDNSTNVCLVEGLSYTMVMMDSYGDGWNGGSFTIVAGCDLASGEQTLFSRNR